MQVHYIGETLYQFRVSTDKKIVTMFVTNGPTIQLHILAAQPKILVKR